MSNGSTQPRLRLVGGGVDHAMLASNRAVQLENRRAATNPALDPADPRWVVAARAHAQLDGVAIRPEKRARLVSLAKRLGLREFDANVIIATVQDRARRGQPLADTQPVLAMLATPGETSRPSVVWWPVWFAATVAALIGAALLIRWVLIG